MVQYLKSIVLSFIAKNYQNFNNLEHFIVIKKRQMHGSITFFSIFK